MMRIQLILATVCLLMLGACGPHAKNLVDPALNMEPTTFRTEVNHWPEEGDHDFDFLEIYDPWEPMNRSLYSFNAGLDSNVVLPITTAYETVIPSPARTGVNNVIQNLNEIPTFVNCVLQGKAKKTGITTSRFLINSTLGVLGLFDWASESESLQRQHEDFGQTFGVWGMGNGPYFVMPAFGPSNLRDTAGFGADFLFLLYQMHYTYELLGVKETRVVAWSELILRALNRRSNTAFRYYSTGSPFEYELVRFIYTKKRELDIKR